MLSVMVWIDSLDPGEPEKEKYIRSSMKAGKEG